VIRSIGDVEGLKISLAGAQEKLDQIASRSRSVTVPMSSRPSSAQ